MKRCFLALVLLACPASVGYGASVPSQTELCPRFLAFSGSVVAEGANYLWLPPKTDRYLLYSLIQTHDGQPPHLAVVGYRGRHAHIHQALELSQELEELGEFDYLAMGELVVQNRSDLPGPGAIRIANETAGFSLLHALPRNDVRELARAARAAAFWSQGGPMVTLSFARTRGTVFQHLFPGADLFIEHFERAKELKVLPESENYRHYLGNRVQAVKGILGNLDDSNKVDAEPSALWLQRTEEALANPMTHEALQLYVKWAHNDQGEIPYVREVEKLLDTAAVRTLTVEERLHFADVFTRFATLPERTSDAEYLISSVQILRLDTPSDLEAQDYIPPSVR